MLACGFFSRPPIEGCDFTFLSVAFGFNATLSVVDCFVRSLVENLRVSFLSQAKFSKNESERCVSDSDRRRERADESVKQGFADVDAYCSDLDLVLRKECFWVKAVMAVCAALSAIFMIWPCTGRATILLLLPFPLFVVWCWVKLRLLYRKKVSLALKRVQSARLRLGISIGASPREKIADREASLMKLLDANGALQ